MTTQRFECGHCNIVELYIIYVGSICFNHIVSQAAGHTSTLARLTATLGSL